MLTHQETASLLRLLYASDQKPLGATGDGYLAAFAREQRFRACCAIVLLLEDTKALKLSQRLAAWFLIHEGWADGPITAHPFASFLVNAAARPDAHAAERNLVLQVLQRVDFEELRKETPEGYMLSLQTPLADSMPDLAALQRLYCPGVLTSSNRPQPTQHHHQHAEGKEGAQTAEGPAAMLARALGTSASNSTSNGDIGPEQRGVLGACWTRPAPPLLSPFVDELAWLGPELHTGLVWDSTAGDAEARARAKGARDLLERALRGPLLPAQQQQVLDALAQDPALVYRLGLAPRHLPPLVEHTPVVAYELLRRLMRSPHRAAGFLAVLAASEMSLRSMEVVNRLAGAVPLPTDFLHLYVTNCISSCENTQDKYVQSRLVRLVCVFLHTLIRSRVIHIGDLAHEVAAFCINFIKVKEAAKLFRLIKQLEAAPSPGSWRSGGASAGASGIGSTGAGGEGMPGGLGSGSNGLSARDSLVHGEGPGLGMHGSGAAGGAGGAEGGDVGPGSDDGAAERLSGKGNDASSMLSVI